ncbi:hypothetical protein EAE96_001479 [Botrytis aclada]|nr:hypothetical protein EAE96_001479 [Botrytis aclada]
MEEFEDIWGDLQSFNLPEADDGNEFLNLPEENPLDLPEDKVKEDKDFSTIYKEYQSLDNVYSSFVRDGREQEAETQLTMSIPIDTKVDESIGNIQYPTASLSLDQYPTIDFPGMPSQYNQNYSAYTTMSSPFNRISNNIRQQPVLERSSALSLSSLSDQDSTNQYKHKEDSSYSMIASRPSSRRREKNSIDKIIEEHNKKHAEKLGVLQTISNLVAPKAIQKRPVRRKGHKYSGSLEGFKAERRAQHSRSRLSEVSRGYQFDHNEPIQSSMFGEEDSSQQLGQAQQVPQSVNSIQHMSQMGQIPLNSTSFQHMGQGMIRPSTEGVQQFDYHYQSPPSPQDMNIQQPNHSFQKMGHTQYDCGSYPFNYISVLHEPHSPLFPERNLWAPQATENLPNQSNHQFQMLATQTHDFETQQYTTMRNGNYATASPSPLHESFESERGSGQYPESSLTSPSFSPLQPQTDHTHSQEKMHEENR